MKKIASMLLAGLAFMSITSCTDADYDEKYADPGTTEKVGVPQVFTGVLYKGNNWMNLRYYRYYTQCTTSGTFGGIVGDSNGKGRFMGAGEGYFNDRWKEFYDMVTQYRLLEYTYNNLTEAEKPANLIFYHLGRALVYSQLHEVLSAWGDVPFRGAGTLWMDGDYEGAKTRCVYDDDVELYKQILSDLKETGDYLNGDMNVSGLTALGRQDYTLAAGRKEIWQKYVNSLCLRIALHLSTNGDCTTEAHAVIKEILENPDKYPLIESNDENMGVAADTQTDAFNYGKSISQAWHTGGTDGLGAVSQAVLTAMNVPKEGKPITDADPRLQAMYDPNPDGEYVAFDVTKTNSEISTISDRKKQEYVKKGMIGPSYYCRVDSLAIGGYKEYEGNINIESIWLNAAEVDLSRAEAYLMGYGVAKDESKAEQYFKDGVRKSVEFYWNMKKNSSLYKGENDSYYGFNPLVEPTSEEITAYIDKIWKADQETVCTQLWLNFGYMNLMEAWNVVRRTGFPVITFAKDTQISNYPTPPNRLPYTSDELNFNSKNCQDAISKNYEESTGYYTNLFWAKKDYYKLITIE